MEGNGQSNLRTRDRILEASGEVFTELGFRNATVRKICDRAGVNVAAINYHFRSKEELYLEVLEYWHEFAIKKYPPLLGVDEEAPVDEQLNAFVRSFLLRMLDKGKPAWFGKLMAREMAEPTRAFDHMVKDVMNPLNRLLALIVRKIVRTDSEEVIRLCCASIFGQCVYYYNARCIEQLFQRDMSSPDEIDRVAEHITQVSLKGLEHYSSSAQRRTEKETALQQGRAKNARRRRDQVSL